ncbi:hypothetical protein [Agrobacterium tumefaciens]|uniref:hypothetical protein n=1 Tax=Agrobacterium tumefaciens TaxID=358 RepID=UPI0021D355F2|nr:hypothetical protein [Agrobacterium tumefaciens]UXS03809.1 hypothetical protein FY156_19925 [Agrobacterium tumefaciens]
MQQSSLLAAASRSGIHTFYYKLCAGYPLRPEEPSIALPSKNLLAATADIIPLEKLRGPGSVYRHLSLPEGLSLNFIIQGRSIVETHFSIETNGTRHESSFAILSKELTEFAGTAKHVPPYPRPAFYSLNELLGILQSFDELARLLYGSSRSSPGC